jgi:hypothetical protein
MKLRNGRIRPRRLCSTKAIRGYARPPHHLVARMGKVLQEHPAVGVLGLDHHQVLSGNSRRAYNEVDKPPLLILARP